MSRLEIELDPVDFVTVGTIGPKGKRVFYLQAGKANQVASLVIEKEQAMALGEAIGELVDDLDERYEEQTEADMELLDMDLREPIEPMFRVAQMGLGYDEDRRMVVLVAQEMIVRARDDSEFDDPLEVEPETEDPGVVRMWCSLEQMRALSLRTVQIVREGRADPKQNGRIIYYWT
jgi:uncharacterized repeat protein (TIGR03847 family)